jgi:RES domain-containing protein
MPDADHFAKALSLVPVRELQATLVRRVAMLPMLASAPVDFLFTSGKAYRYNPGGVECVYFAEDEATAAAEYEFHHPGQRQPVTTFFAEVRLRQVLDLGHDRTLSLLGINASELRAAWRGARKPTVTQLLGEAVNRQADIAAIRFPSEAARLKGFAGANVVIYRDCVQHHDQVHILGPTKKPLQKWP